MDVWMEAEHTSNSTLYEKAIQHLVHRPQGQSLQQVPGFTKAFQDHPKPLKDLLDKLASNNFSLKEEVAALKERLEGYQGEFGPIEIIVVHKNDNNEVVWREEFEVLPLDKINSLLVKLAEPLQEGPDNWGEREPLEDGQRYRLTKEYSETTLAKNRTFEAANIRTKTTLRAHVV